MLWYYVVSVGVIALSRKIIIMLHFVSPTNLKSYLKNIKRRIKYRHLIQEHYLTDHHNFKQQVMMIFLILLLHLSPPLIFPTPPLKYFHHCSSWHVTPCHCHHRHHQQEHSGASHFHQMTSTVWGQWGSSGALSCSPKQCFLRLLDLQKDLCKNRLFVQ